jgi:iron complex outermembrane recepter protein
MSTRRIVLLMSSILSILAAPVRAEQPKGALLELDLKRLLNEPVTSVSKKQTKLSESPAAIAIITQQDIRRSGHTSLPELLRMVAGLDVARIHGNEWAISARGFNDQYANKLLVLIDGRSIYTPMFAGVYWNVQDIVLEDIERIEVIRGPGATLWGANAVNGVINITTKSAHDTQGSLVSASFGTEERPATTARYGGQLSENLHYRTYARYFSREGFRRSTSEDAPDDWSNALAGARLDWQPTPDDLLTAQGEYYRGRMGEHFETTVLTAPFTQPLDPVHHNDGGHVIGRWSRQLAATSQLMVQTYYDQFEHWDGDSRELRKTFDVEMQHRSPVGRRHDVVWGANYRYTSDEFTSSFYLTFDPNARSEQLYSMFVQDEITLIPAALRLTLGTKLEHNESIGLEAQPSARLLWTAAHNHTFWGSFSRAVRTPSRYDRYSRLNATVFQPPASPPFVVSLFGNRDADSEEVLAYELGWRFEPTSHLSFDLAGFYNEYDGVLMYVAEPVAVEAEPAPSHLLLPLVFQNGESGITYGSELSVRWQVSDTWRLMASHTFLRMRMEHGGAIEDSNPRQQFQLHSYLDLPRDLQLNAAAYYVDSIESPLDNDYVKIDSYVRVDLSAVWRPMEELELSITGQNLLDNRHVEYGSFKTSRLTEIPRTVLGRVTWSF